MHTRHSTLLLAGHLLQRIDFDPASFQSADLLWLPHHALLAAGGRKRQTEHLAGRIAAVHALREVGEKMPPPPGEQRQPLWPAPWFGSISHCENSALAVVSSYPIGIDIERCLTPALAAELESSIINAAEKPLLAASGLPFELALTLAFSAKESGFKALPLPRQTGMDFLRMRITSIKEGMLRMQIDDERVEVHWLQSDGRVITLCGKRK